MRRKTIISLLFVVVGFVTTLGIVFFYQSRKTITGGGSKQSAVFAEKSADAGLITVTGEKFQTEQWLAGKVLLIFLSSDCDACKDEASQISEIYPELTSQLKVYGVSVDNKEATAIFIKNNEIRFPVVVDENQKLAQSVMLKGLPTKFMLKDGIIEKRMLGKFADAKAAREAIMFSTDQ